MTYVTERFMCLAGIAVMITICWALSRRRKAIKWNVVGYGLGLQLFFALIILVTPIGRPFFDAMNEAFLFLGTMGKEGARFLVGDLVDQYFLFGVLPTIIVYAGLLSLLYYWGIMQRIVGGVAWVMRRTMKVSGAESVAAAANVFIGQTEAPLVVKPFLRQMTTSEMMALMTGGLATVAGGVMAACVIMLGEKIPDIAGHMMAASIMSAPAAILFAKLLLPEVDKPVTSGDKASATTLFPEELADNHNSLDAYSRGASDGMRMVINIAAMLVAFVGIVWGINQVLGASCGYLGEVTGWSLTNFDSLEKLFGYLFWPFACLMGIPVEDAWFASHFLAEKTVINEFVAYSHLADVIGSPATTEGAAQMSERTKVILTYALCGFANFSSLGIQIGGISVLVPERRKDLARLAPWALLAGTFACFQTACFAGLLL